MSGKSGETVKSSRKTGCASCLGQPPMTPAMMRGKQRKRTEIASSLVGQLKPISSFYDRVSLSCDIVTPVALLSLSYIRLQLRFAMFTHTSRDFLLPINYLKQCAFQLLLMQFFLVTFSF